MITFQKKIKENINLLISDNRLNEAKELLTQYENIVNDDIDIYSFKGMIAMMKGDMDEAERVLTEGFNVDRENFDLLCNLAYLYQSQDNHVKAYEFYNRAKEYAIDGEIKKKIEEILNEYNKIEEIELQKNKLSIKQSSYPKVTIRITTYNQKEHLKEAIESCLQQDYPNLEILVIDDCSQDGTDTMMETYRNNKRIKYIRNKINLGPGNNTRNMLYNLIDSKYAMYFNHDDYLIKNDYISKAVKLLMNYPNLSFVWANCKIKNEISGKGSITNFKNSKITNGIDYFLNYETPQRPHITGQLTTVFDVEKLRATGFGDEKTKSKDTFMYLKLMLMGDVGFIDEHVSVYRVHKKSLSFNMPVEFDESTIIEFEKLKKKVLDNKIANEETMEKWINNRVFSYVIWRFPALWNSKNKRYALELLMSISKEYPFAYERILEKI